MRVVYFVSSDKKSKAEDLLKKDDVVNRGSILLKSAGSLDMKDDGYFIVYDGSEEAVKLADKLLKGLAERYKKAEEVLKKIDEQENSAIEGFGNILG